MSGEAGGRRIGFRNIDSYLLRFQKIKGKSSNLRLGAELLVTLRMEDDRSIDIVAAMAISLILEKRVSCGCGFIVEGKRKIWKNGYKGSDKRYDTRKKER
ncbi:Hypothetical predicted protein, partial [Olea europaea subsp. europaea]